MFSLLNKSNFLFKKNDTHLINPEDGESDVRAIRDKSTDLYTERFFDNINILSLFLDYTFHELYSQVITNINLTLVNKINLVNPIVHDDDDAAAERVEVVEGEEREYNEHIHIKPLVGDENVFLIFKGGSLMKQNFDRHLADIRANNNLMDSTIQTVIDKYFLPRQIHNLSEFNVNLETNNDQVFEGRPNTARTFIEQALNSKFKISDTDYSLFINTEHNDRFLIFNNICTKHLGSALDTITRKFDNYFNHVINGNIYRPDRLDQNYEEYILHDSDSCVYDPNYTTSELLLRLKTLLDNNVNIDRILNNDPVIGAELDNNLHIRAFLTIAFAYSACINRELIERGTPPIRINHNNGFRLKNNDLYQIYDDINILTLILYIIKISNDKDNINFHTTNLEGGLDLVTQESLSEVITNYKKKVKNIVDYKFRVLVRNNFYTNDKINDFKNDLAREFRQMHNNRDYNGIKCRRSNDPNYYKQKVSKIRINPLIQNITPDNFVFEPRKSCVKTASSDPFKNVSNGVLKNNDGTELLKIHYITYNNAIRQTLANGKVINDFDLIRSKFNITIPNEFIDYLDENNQVVPPEDPTINFTVPSEFIDVSIVRYDDTARKFFFDEAAKNFYKPHKNEIQFHDQDDNIRNIIVHSYSPLQLTEDLFYVLTTKDILEPWIDKKYKKRIIRGVFLVNLVIHLYGIIRHVDNDEQLNLIQNPQQDYNRDIWGEPPNRNLVQHPPILNDFTIFFRYVMNLYDNIINNRDVPNVNLFLNFLQNYNPNDQNDITRKRNYINSIYENIDDLLSVNSEIPIINIDHKYYIVMDILKTMLFWNKLYFINDPNLIDILNKMRLFYHITPLNQQNINNVKLNFIRFIRILFDYGIKTLFLFDTREGPQYIDNLPPAQPLPAPIPAPRPAPRPQPRPMPIPAPRLAAAAAAEAESGSESDTEEEKEKDIEEAGAGPAIPKQERKKYRGRVQRPLLEGGKLNIENLIKNNNLLFKKYMKYKSKYLNNN